MRWRYARASMLILMVMTGCPSEFGKDGRVSKAVHNDSLELVRKHCSKAQEDQFCGGYKKDTQECHEHCG
jgi:hypothetical protein